MYIRFTISYTIQYGICVLTATCIINNYIIILAEEVIIYYYYQNSNTYCLVPTLKISHNNDFTSYEYYIFRVI